MEKREREGEGNYEREVGGKVKEKLNRNRVTRKKGTRSGKGLWGVPSIWRPVHSQVSSQELKPELCPSNGNVLRLRKSDSLATSNCIPPLRDRSVG